MDEVTAARLALLKMGWMIRETHLPSFVRFYHLMSELLDHSVVPDYAGAIERAMSDA